MRFPFDVRRRELPRLLPITFAYGLVMASLYILKPARNALFLDRIGVGQLPYVMTLVALVGGAAALVFTRFAARARLDRLVLATFALLGACLLGFHALLPLGWGWTFYLFYVWVNLYGLLATSLLWLLANALFNAREGRRLFGLIGTAGIVGAVAGGAFTSWVVARVGTGNLLLVCAAAVAACLLLLYPVRLRETAAAPAGALGEGPLQTVRGSQLLTLLAGMAGLAAAVAAVIDVQFNHIVDAAFADVDAKTAFFGRFFAGLSAFAFLFQVGVTPRVLRSLGVTSALLFLPLSMALGSAAVLVAPGLAAGVLLKIGDGGFRHSIHKSATEILYLPVPVAAKKRAKVLVDTTVDNLATGIGALAVIAALGAGLSYRHLGFVSLALVGLWLALVVRSRRAYVDAFRRALERREIDLAGYTVDIAEAGTLDSLVALLRRTANERHLLYALDMLAPVRAERLVAPLAGLLDHPAPAVRERALRVLHGQSGPLPLARLEALLEDDSLAVRVAAFHAVCVHGPGARGARVRAALASPDRRLRSAAVGCVAEHGTQGEHALVDEPLVRALLEGAAGDEAELVQVARLIGRVRDRAPWVRDAIARLAEGHGPAVVGQLVESLGDLADERDLPWLVARLDDRRTRRPAAAALARYGDAAVPVLAARVRDESLPASSRNRAARALAGIPSPACVAAALETLDAVPPGLQYQLVKSLSKLRQRDESLAFPPPVVGAALRQAARGYWELMQTLALLPPARGPGGQLLRRAVAEKRDQHLKRIFRFLALQHPPKDLYNAYLGYVSGDRAARASALELLENVLGRADRELVVPLLDAPTSAEVVAAGAPAFGAPLATAAAAIDRLLAGGDPWLRACAARALLDDPTPAERDRVAPLVRDADPVVRETAAQVLGRRG